MNEIKSLLYLPDVGALNSWDNIETGQFAGRNAHSVWEEELVSEADKPEFHIGQGYEGKPAKALQCRLCGGSQFYVGEGEYFTGIKCIVCEWEMCIHDG